MKRAIHQKINKEGDDYNNDKYNPTANIAGETSKLKLMMR